MTVLLLDDDPFVLSLLRRQLQQLGHEVRFSCQRAMEALEVLRDENCDVDLILCDLQMPEMDGVEFVRQLVGLGCDTPSLVFVSGEDERILHSVERLARAHDLSVLGALRKPVATSQLSEVLNGSAGRPRGSTLAGMPPHYTSEALRQAISAGQLVTHYQPKVTMADARVVGVEALVRWQHPRDGLLSPNLFIPLAEQTGLIEPLLDTVLATTMEQLQTWRDSGLELHAAVNVSMANLVRLDFPERIARLAANHGLPKSTLVLEVTESLLMGDVTVLLDILTRLRLKRFGLSIDDFGTGHSSLASLRDLPFDELKVDRGFVHGCSGDASLQAIVEHSLRLARQLGLRSVAEGVEDREDWDYLAAAECSLAQGYFIGRPMPAEAFPSWVAEWETRRASLTRIPRGAGAR